MKHQCGPASSIHIPREIRLRKATVPKVSYESVSHTTDQYENRDGDTMKSVLAEAALTRTAVHLYPPESLKSNDLATEPLKGKERKLSATLQVVRSSNSVYEII